jgi:hypothetical protein
VLIGWINNHDKVRDILDKAQASVSPDVNSGKIIVLAYLVANLTRWTTHFVAFHGLFHLRRALQFAESINRNAIIVAQVGAAKGAEKDRLEAEATTMCDLICNRDFWHGLETVLGDIEPICYGTNINQKDSTRADQVLLTLVGLYHHFSVHPEPDVSAGMIKRLEKRWKESDQPLFLLSLILNPFEKLATFGPSAELSKFKLGNLLVHVHCVLFIPTQPDLT